MGHEDRADDGGDAFVDGEADAHGEPRCKELLTHSHPGMVRPARRIVQLLGLSRTGTMPGSVKLPL